MQLAFQQYGSGQTLLILHGLFGSSDNWHTISRSLGEHFHVFAVDLRNHGRSPHAPEMSFELMAQDLEELVARRIVSNSKVNVLGHSLGGKVAMQFALTFPERINKLIVVDIAAKSYPPWHAEIFKGLLSLDLPKITTRAEADSQLAAFVSDPVVRAFLLKNLARNPEGGFFWKFNLQSLADNYQLLTSALASNTQFIGPTLFIAGEKSDYLTASDLPALQKLFPAATLQLISNAGHWVHAEQPAAFLKTVSDFLGNSTNPH